MIASGKPAVAPIGLPLLVFFPVLLSPANPQSYEPQSYLITAVLALSSVAVLFVGLTAVLPTSDAQKRRWLLGSARADLIAVLRARRPRRGTDLVRDADRIAQVAALHANPSRASDLAVLFWMAEVAELARRLRDQLDIANSPDTDVQRGLTTLDASLLRRCASGLAEQGPQARRDLVFGLGHVIRAIEYRPPNIERFLREGPV